MTLLFLSVRATAGGTQRHSGSQFLRSCVRSVLVDTHPYSSIGALQSGLRVRSSSPSSFNSGNISNVSTEYGSLVELWRFASRSRYSNSSGEFASIRSQLAAVHLIDKIGVRFFGSNSDASETDEPGKTAEAASDAQQEDLLTDSPEETKVSDVRSKKIRRGSNRGPSSALGAAGGAAQDGGAIQLSADPESKDRSSTTLPRGNEANNSIIPVGPHPGNFPKVLAIPLRRRPLFPGFYVPVTINNPKLADALVALKAMGTPYVGTFLLNDGERSRGKGKLGEVGEREKERTGTVASAELESEEEKEVSSVGPRVQDGKGEEVLPVLGQLLGEGEGEKGEEKRVEEDEQFLAGEDLYDRLQEVGTFAQIQQVIRSLDGSSSQVLLVGHRRIRLTGMVERNPLTVSVEHLKDQPYDSHNDILKATVMEVVSSLKDLMRMNPLYKEHITMFVQVGTRQKARNGEHAGEFNPSRMADFGAALTTAEEPSLQEVLAENNVEKRLHLTLTLLKKELDLARLQASIARGVEEKISGDQRRFFLMEQLKAIKKELGLEKDDKSALIGKFEEKLNGFRDQCPEQVLQVINEELAKLSLLEPSSSEFSVTRNYLDWLSSLPWGIESEENFDVFRAEQILNADHYGLEEVKERVLELIAVGKMKGNHSQGKILCLVGPPGVGKTSIGRSIALSLNRKFFRFSVGGLSDVAEIKGHRRTYVGAMPGKMVQCLKTTQSSNPLVLIDEIDKLGRGHSGDPASALLELLDPEQNFSFVDHYLDVPLDCSKVLFICTANVLETIPSPLMDRMEVIRIPGYISEEKKKIARQYLEPTARKSTGVEGRKVVLTDAALTSLVETYCRESGVRNLQKYIDKIFRKVALNLVREQDRGKERREGESAGVEPLLVENEAVIFEKAEILLDDEGLSVNEKLTSKSEEAAVLGNSLTPEIEVVIDENNLVKYAGNPTFQSERIYPSFSPPGVVTGLAWTAMGGSILYIETAVVERVGEKEGGKGGGGGGGHLQLTGHMGDVMRESANIALTLTKRILREKEREHEKTHSLFPSLSGAIEAEALPPHSPSPPLPLSPAASPRSLLSSFSRYDLHLHVPMGATPKDGPSAGITMVTSLLSLVLNKRVRENLAMTGEVTLTGRVLPIGGVKEKTIAAKRNGMLTLIFPLANKRDYEELPDFVREGLTVHFVQEYEEVFKIAFEYDEEREVAGK